MDKLELTKEMLFHLDVPTRQQSKLCCLTILAMAGLERNMPWKKATNKWKRIHDVLSFISENYDINYAENSRETFRKQAMHPFRLAALIEDNGEVTNSPNYRYRITKEFLAVLRTVGEDEEIGCNRKLKSFIKKHNSLSSLYASKKKIRKMPVKINNVDYSLSHGKHNMLQKAIIEEFAPRFAPNSECLYMGDTTHKDMLKNEKKLSDLGLEITIHNKMPDVVLYREEKGWIYFIEAVTSVGPIDPKRRLEIDSMTANSHVAKIYVTAFLNFVTFKKFSSQLAWETEVWIADMPDHMIHFNGNKFLGPHNDK